MRETQEKSFPMTSIFVIVCVLLACGTIFKNKISPESFEAIKSTVGVIHLNENIFSYENISDNTSSGQFPCVVIARRAGM